MYGKKRKKTIFETKEAIKKKKNVDDRKTGKRLSALKPTANL
jgi:hypothetical protein